MKKYPQHIQRQLRETALIALEKEMKQQLQEIAKQVQSWEAEELSHRELRHLLHRYVEGPSRELFRHHREVPHDIFVADAIARKILDRKDIPEAVLPYIEHGAVFYSDVLENNSDDE